MSAKKVADALSGVLADSYVLQVKTQNYHWNVVGPYFHSLHVLFEGQYSELFVAVDEIAERIRQLGYTAPGSLAEFLKLTVIFEKSSDVAPGMVADLAACNEKISTRILAALKIAEENNDDGTQDLMVRRLQAHNKAAWMLRATLGDEAAEDVAPVAAKAAPKSVPVKAKKTVKTAAAAKPVKAVAKVANSVAKKASPKPKTKPKVKATSKKAKPAPKPASKPKGKVALG